MLSYLVSQPWHGFAGDLAVDAIVLDRDGALDHQQVFPLILLHGFYLDLLHLVAGVGIQCLVVVQSNSSCCAS